MEETPVLTEEGKEAGTVELPEAVFGIEPNQAALYYAVRMYLANRRAGTASAKERSQVSGGTRKPWRQKGTGRARQGTIRAPQWTGGGVVFGPRPRDFRYRIPVKMKRLAIRSALTLKARDDRLKVLDKFSFDSPKTKRMAQILRNIDLENSSKVLLLVSEYDRNLFLSGRNIPGLNILKASNVNAYDVLWADYLVVTKAGIDVLREVFGRK